MVIAIKKISVIKLSIINTSAGLALFVTLAFHNITKLLLIFQLLFAVQVFFPVVFNRKPVSRYAMRYLLWWALFTIYNGASFIWSVNNETWFSCLLAILQVAMLGSSIVFYCDNEQRRDFLIKILAFSGIVLCVRLILAVPPGVWGSERIGNYIGYGNVGVTYVLSYVSLFSFYYAQKHKSIYYYAISIVLIVFSCLSGTKKAIFIAIVGISLFVILQKKKGCNILYRIIFCIFFIFVFYYAIMNIDILYKSLGSRFESFLGLIRNSGVDKSTRDRLLLIKYSWDTFADNPFFGIGLDAFRYSNPTGLYAHNNYLELLSCLGIIGTIIYYYLPINLFISSSPLTSRGDNYYTVIFVIILCLLIMDITTVSYSQETIQIMIAVLYASFSNNKLMKGNTEYEKNRDVHLL